MSNEQRPDIVSPWIPMQNPTALKHLGKLGEETCELGAAVSRCIIQGIDEREPVTGKPNREWLEDEIADVIANIEVVGLHFELDQDRIAARIMRKKQNLRDWHRMITPFGDDMLFDMFEQACLGPGDKYDHGHIAIYEAAQRHFIHTGRIRAADCVFND